ncbi:hypothetical protein GCM10027085_17570 [Spirosoma aerophilum]
MTNRLDFLYWRSTVGESRAEQLPIDRQASVLLPAIEPDQVPAPFRWHLKEADRRRLPPTQGSPFSTSIHHLTAWAELAGKAELVFYSPVFASISKPGYGPSVSLETVSQQIAAIRQQHDRLPRLIGLGGIQADNIRLVRQAGFDGAALMGALWQSPNPIDAFDRLKEASHR